MRGASNAITTTIQSKLIPETKELIMGVHSTIMASSTETKDQTTTTTVQGTKVTGRAKLTTKVASSLATEMTRGKVGLLKSRDSKIKIGGLCSLNTTISVTDRTFKISPDSKWSKILKLIWTQKELLQLRPSWLKHQSSIHVPRLLRLLVISPKLLMS